LFSIGTAVKQTDKVPFREVALCGQHRDWVQYGHTITGNATAIHRPNTTRPILTHQLQYDAFAENNNKQKSNNNQYKK
jgi:hypothetical protein